MKSSIQNYFLIFKFFLYFFSVQVFLLPSISLLQPFFQPFLQPPHQYFHGVVDAGITISYRNAKPLLEGSLLRDILTTSTSPTEMSLQMKSPFEQLALFPSTITTINTTLLSQRIDQYLPFIGMNAYIRQVNMVLAFPLQERSQLPQIIQQIHEKGIIPFLFIPMEHMLYYVEELIQIKIPFKLLTLSTNNYCMPFYQFPSICSTANKDDFMQIICHPMYSLLHSPSLLQWYTTNPCIVHNKLIVLPIGPKWQFESKLLFDEDLTSMKDDVYKSIGTLSAEYFFNQTSTDNYDNGDNSDEIVQKFFTGKKVENLLFVGDLSENEGDSYYEFHQSIRSKLKTLLVSKGLLEETSNHVMAGNTPSTHREYMKEMSQYKFAIAPPGAGMDTHRTWEALMVGTIPIVLSSPLNMLYDHLPVLIVEDYEILTEDLLNRYYEVFHNEMMEYDFNRIYLSYWMNLLHEDINSSSSSQQQSRYQKKAEEEVVESSMEVKV